jgi:hypothetical protein
MTLRIAGAAARYEVAESLEALTRAGSGRSLRGVFATQSKLDDAAV